MQALRCDYNCIGRYALWTRWCPCLHAPTTRTVAAMCDSFGSVRCWWTRAWGIQYHGGKDMSMTNACA